MNMEALFEHKSVSKVTQKIAAFGGLLVLRCEGHPLLVPELVR
jgi:hypothetical protein